MISGKLLRGYLDKCLKLGHQFLFVLICLGQCLLKPTFKIIPIERRYTRGRAGGGRALREKVGCLATGCSVDMTVCSVVGIGLSRSRSKRLRRSGISRTRQATLRSIYLHPLLWNLRLNMLLRSVLRFWLSAGRRRRLESLRGCGRRRGWCCRSEVFLHFDLLRRHATNLQGAGWSAAAGQPGSGMLNTGEVSLLSPSV